jgi:hypothetical protein
MNEFGLRFEPLFPVGWLLGFATISFALLVWLELSKKQKLIALRVAALFFMTLSVIGLILQPSFSSKQNQGALLLTRGYDRQKVDSVVTLHPELRIDRTPSAGFFPNSHELAENWGSRNFSYIIGEGLPVYALDEFSPSSFVFLPSQLPEGVVELNIPEMHSDRKHSLSGIFNTNQKTKLKLIGPAGVEDSIIVDQRKKAFTFSVTPKQPGLFIYQLVSEDSLGTKVSERLPIDVKSAAGLHILFLQDFPSSEFHYLKSFLAEDGHSIVVRTRTSRDNFTEEFINIPKFQLKNISVDLLNTFDLLFIDSKTIESLSTLEKSNLGQAVRNGLGLMVSGEHSKKKEFYTLKGKEISADTAYVRLKNKSYLLPAIPIEVSLGADTKSILENKKRALTGYRFFGAGKIGFQLLQETHRIRLEGNSDDYAAIWSELIEKISRKETRNFELKIDTHFPYYADEPISFSVVSAGGSPEVFSDGVKIPLSEDVIVDDYWQGKTWAGNPGWHQLRMVDSTTINYFVHEPSEWRTLRAAYSTSETRIAQNKTQENQSSSSERKPVSLFIFYFIFLLAGGFLWLAPKI